MLCEYLFLKKTAIICVTNFANSYCNGYNMINYEGLSLRNIYIEYLWLICVQGAKHPVQWRFSSEAGRGKHRFVEMCAWFCWSRACQRICNIKWFQYQQIYRKRELKYVNGKYIGDVILKIMRQKFSVKLMIFQIPLLVSCVRNNLPNNHVVWLWRFKKSITMIIVSWWLRDMCILVLFSEFLLLFKPLHEFFIHCRNHLVTTTPTV